MSNQVAPDGKPATQVTLTNRAGMTIRLMDIGACWQSCILPCRKGGREVLLSPGGVEDYFRHGAYMGASVGRYANRIGKGQYLWMGETVQLETNQAGNTLHGGPQGFSHRRWEIAEQSETEVLFRLHSPAGDQGFPGNVTAEAHYRLGEDNSVNIEYRATTDAPTPLGLTNHAYFNLQGEGDVLAHQLQIDALQYLPVNEVGIPFGELERVSGSSFDFLQPKTIGQDFLADDQQKSAKGYDHAFFFPVERDIDEPVATLTAPDGEVSLTVITNQPAIQLYTGNWLGGEPKREGGVYQDHHGVALETQLLPDSPNHPHWPQPNPILEPGEEYLHSVSYLFQVAE